MKSRRGMALLIMLGALVLLGAFALLASRLFHSSLRVVRTGQDAQTRMIRTDGMLSTLRADVWNARKIESTDKGIQIHPGGDGQVIQWRITEQGLVRQDAGSDPPEQTWNELEQIFTFEASGALLVVRARPVRGSEADEIVLPSQLLLSSRSNP